MRIIIYYALLFATFLTYTEFVGHSSLPPLIVDFLRSLRAAENKSPHTIAAYRRDLSDLVRTLSIPVEKATSSDLLLYFEALYEVRRSTATRLRKIATFQKFYRWLVSRRLIVENPMSDFPKPKLTRSLPTVLTETEFRTLAQQPERSHGFMGVRDRALFALLLSTGLRLSECVSLDTSALNIRELTLKVRRKGGNEQLLPVSPGAAHYLGEYLKRRYLRLEGKKDGPLFISNRNTRLSARAIQALIQRYGKLCGIPKRVSPHALRHTFATYCLEAGVDIVVVRDMLGHTSVKTTERYVHTTTRYLKDALAKISIF